MLPRIAKVLTPAGEGDGTGLAARRGRPSVAAEVDLDGLRPHRPGAPASRMYWPAFARTGELVERRMRADTDTRPLVVLDPRGAADNAALDAAVRAAASLAVHLARQGGCALLLPGDRRPTALEPTLAAWEHAHARLAVVDRRARPERRGARGAPRPGLLRGGERSAAAAAGADARAGRRADPRRARHACPAAAPIFTVAGCAAYELSGQRAPAEVA